MQNTINSNETSLNTSFPENNDQEKRKGKEKAGGDTSSMPGGSASGSLGGLSRFSRSVNFVRGEDKDVSISTWNAVKDFNNDIKSPDVESRQTPQSKLKSTVLDIINNTKANIFKQKKLAEGRLALQTKNENQTLIIKAKEDIAACDERIAEAKQLDSLPEESRDYVLKQHRKSNITSGIMSGTDIFSRGPTNTQERWQKDNLRGNTKNRARPISITLHDVVSAPGERVLMPNRHNTAEREWVISEGERSTEVRAIYTCKPEASSSQASFSSMLSSSSQLKAEGARTNSLDSKRTATLKSSASNTNSRTSSMASVSSQRSAASNIPLEDVGSGHTFILFGEPNSEGEQEMEIFQDEEAKREFRKFSLLNSGSD